MDKIVAEKARVTGKSPDQVYADFTAQTALGRFVEESDVAAAIRFLVSPGAGNITGHDIPVDAGEFRLLDRKVADYLKSLTEHTRYLRGLTVLPGFRQTSPAKMK